MADEAAVWFSLGFARALASGGDAQAAFTAAVTTVLTITEPGRLDCGRDGWVQKYEFGDPERLVPNQNLKRGRRAAEHGARVVAGMPWLLHRVAHYRRVRVPPLGWHPLGQHATHERLLTDALHCISRAVIVGPHGIGVAQIALVGGAGLGKSLLASWLAHDVRTQALAPDGVIWIDCGRAAGSNHAVDMLLHDVELSPPIPNPEEGVGARPVTTAASDADDHTGSRIAVDCDACSVLSAALGSRRFLVVLDDLCSAEPLKPLLSLEPPSSLIVVYTTRSLPLAKSLAGGAHDSVVSLEHCSDDIVHEYASRFVRSHPVSSFCMRRPAVPRLETALSMCIALMISLLMAVLAGPSPQLFVRVVRFADEQAGGTQPRLSSSLTMSNGASSLQYGAQYADATWPSVAPMLHTGESLVWFQNVQVMNAYVARNTWTTSPLPPSPPPSSPPPTCGELFGVPRNGTVEVEFDRSTVLINNLGGWSSSSQPAVLRYGSIGTLPDGTVIDLLVENLTEYHGGGTNGLMALGDRTFAVLSLEPPRAPSNSSSVGLQLSFLASGTNTTVRVNRTFFSVVNLGAIAPGVRECVQSTDIAEVWTGASVERLGPAPMLCGPLADGNSGVQVRPHTDALQRSRTVMTMLDNSSSLIVGLGARGRGATSVSFLIGGCLPMMADMAPPPPQPTAHTGLQLEWMPLAVMLATRDVLSSRKPRQLARLVDEDALQRQFQLELFAQWGAYLPSDSAGRRVAELHATWTPGSILRLAVVISLAALASDKCARSAVKLLSERGRVVVLGVLASVAFLLLCFLAVLLSLTWMRGADEYRAAERVAISAAQRFFVADYVGCAAPPFVGCGFWNGGLISPFLLGVTMWLSVLAPGVPFVVLLAFLLKQSPACRHLMMARGRASAVAVRISRISIQKRSL